MIDGIFLSISLKAPGLFTARQVYITRLIHRAKRGETGGGRKECAREAFKNLADPVPRCSGRATNVQLSVIANRNGGVIPLIEVERERAVAPLLKVVSVSSSVLHCPLYLPASAARSHHIPRHLANLIYYSTIISALDDGRSTIARQPGLRDVGRLWNEDVLSLSLSLIHPSLLSPHK